MKAILVPALIGLTPSLPPPHHNTSQRVTMVAGQTEDVMMDTVQSLPTVAFVDSETQQKHRWSLPSPPEHHTTEDKGERRGHEEGREDREGARESQKLEKVTQEETKKGGERRRKDRDGVLISTAPDPSPPPPPPSAKDGGYAWVVVLVVFCVNILVAGYIKSFGILYILLVDYFPATSGAQAGWIIGLLVGCRGLLSPVMTALTVLVGPRRCVIAGSVIAAAGLLAAIPAFSIHYMAFTLGGVVGVGLCLSETPGYLLVTNYFLEKRPLANGIRAAGNPMGGIIFSPLVVFLHQEFGLQGALLILAGSMLQIMVLGSLLRPFGEHEIMIRAEHRRRLRDEFGITLSNDELQKKTEATDKAKKKPLDFSFLVNPPYLVYPIMVFSMNFALPNALMYAPVHGSLIGLSAYENSIVAAYISGSDFLLRLVCGWLANKNFMKKSKFLIGGFLLGGVGCMLIPLCMELWQIMAASTLLSFCFATFWTLITTLLADQFGGDAMPSTYGFFRMAQGVASFVYPSIIGLLLDITGSMLVPYMVMGGGLMLTALIFAFQPAIARLSGAKITLE